MSWPQVALDSICEINVGRTPSRYESAYWEDGIHPWVSISDMSRSRRISQTKERISEKARIECNMKPVEAGTVLLSFKLSIGKVSLADGEIYTNEAIAALPVLDKKRLDAGYLARALEAIDFTGTGNRAVMGATLNKASLRKLKIPLPPLEEQKRIAAILDQADELRRKRQRAIDRLNQLGQAIFHETFVLGKGEWPEKPLADVVTPGTIVTYGIVQAGAEFPGGVPYIRTGDIKDGQIALGGLRHTDPAIASKFERSRVREGEIVMSIRATVGTVAFVPKELDGANLTQGTARISPGPDVEPWYLIEYIRSSSIQSWIDQQVKGATFREITLTRLREMTVVVPPQKIQRQFSATMDDVSAQLSFAVEALNEAEALFASLQYRAFQGEL